MLSLSCLLECVDGSHFRGGIITWKPVSQSDLTSGSSGLEPLTGFTVRIVESGREFDKSDCIVVLLKVEFSYKIAWRRSSQSPVCTEEDIRKQTLQPGEKSWDCVQGCSGTISAAPYFCTDYSELEDWTQGEYTFQYTFQSSGPFVVRSEPPKLACFNVRVTLDDYL